MWPGRQVRADLQGISPSAGFTAAVRAVSYFLCELPVVTYWNPSIEELFGSFVVFYGDYHGQSRSLDEAIGTAMHQRNDYRVFAKGFAWDSIVSEFERRICKAI